MSNRYRAHSAPIYSAQALAFFAIAIPIALSGCDNDDQLLPSALSRLLSNEADSRFNNRSDSNGVQLNSANNQQTRDRESAQKRIAELALKIDDLSDVIDRKVSAAKDLAEYYRAIVVEYIGQDMWELARNNALDGLLINPSDSELLYFVGLSTANLAKFASSDIDTREMLYEEAYAYYQLSVKNDPSQFEARYASVILGLYELRRLDGLSEHVEWLLQNESQNWRVVMVAAHYFALLDDRSRAIALYQDVAENSKDSELRMAAHTLSLNLGAGR